MQLTGISPEALIHYSSCDVSKKLNFNLLCCAKYFSGFKAKPFLPNPSLISGFKSPTAEEAVTK